MNLELPIQELAIFLKMEVLELQKLIHEKFQLPLKTQKLSPGLVRELALSLGHVYSPKIISFQMLKGGVAKTTSALNIGIRAAMYGAKVLFVDLDQQANLSFALGHNPDEVDHPVWLDLIEKKSTVEELIISLDENVDLIPSGLNNSVLDRVLLNSNRNWAQSVKVPLDQIRANYDLIVIDTAPALSAVNTAVTVASDLVVLPVNPDRFSWMGLQKNIEELSEIKKDFNLGFDYKVLFTRFDAREKLSQDFMAKAQAQFGRRFMGTAIRTCSEIKNSVRSTKSLFHGRSTAKQDYDSASQELLGDLHV